MSGIREKNGIAIRGGVRDRLCGNDSAGARRIKTMTCWPNFFDKPSANNRARMSIVVPAVIGVTIVIGFEGYRSCAGAGNVPIKDSANATKKVLACIFSSSQLKHKST